MALTIATVTRAAAREARDCSKSDQNIATIGHRPWIQQIQRQYLPDKEDRRGAAVSAAYERSIALVSDPAANEYINRIAERIAQNSDVDLSVKVRIVSRPELSAITFPGGYEYLTTGLILQLQSEGELASVLARGVAHTALRSISRNLLRTELMRATNLAIARPSSSMPCGDGFTVLYLCRSFESQADYFGIQYLYKAGYDPDCFLRAIQTIRAATRTGPQSDSLSPLPPLPDRLRLLRKEISAFLPAREGAIVSTPAFGDFQMRVRRLQPPQRTYPRPTLVRDGDNASR